MTEENNTLNLKEYIEALKETAPEQDARDAAQGRAAFLAQAENRQAADHPGWFARISERFHSLFTQAIQQRTNAIASLLIAVILASGIVGGTVYAAQDSLPDQTLYAVKTFTEDIRLRYAAQAGQKIQLLELFSLRRVEELSALSKQGQEIPTSTLFRMEQHTDTLLQLSAAQEESELPRTLLRVQNVLQSQEKSLERLAHSENGSASQAVSRIQKDLHTKLVLVEQGMDDPASFRKNINSSIPIQPQPTETKDKLHREETPDATGKPEEDSPPQGNENLDHGQPPDRNEKPEDARPPDDPGKSQDPAPSEGKRKQDDHVPPEDKGKPDDPGPPRGKKKPDQGGPSQGKGKPQDK